MNTQFLKKYQPLFFKDFTIDKEYIELLNTLNKMDSLNILLVGNNGSGKTSLLQATIREYYNLKDIPSNNVLIINNLKEQGISYYRSEVKTFCQTPSIVPNKKKFIILDDIDIFVRCKLFSKTNNETLVKTHYFSFHHYRKSPY